MPNAMHPYRGQMLSVAALARIAGCSPAAMRKRLKHGSAAEAVAMGAADKTRNKRRPEPPAPVGGRPIRSGIVFSAPGVTRHVTGVAP